MGQCLLLVLSLILCQKVFSLTDPLVVSTSSGRVKGAKKDYEGINKNGTYYSFRGIPYALPPVGDLRFKDPQPVQTWAEIKDVSGGPGEPCPQANLMSIKPENIGKLLGSEDCLFLNIETEEIPSSKSRNSLPLKPVMFYIHGGAFLMGAGAGQKGQPEFDADYLLETGMVLVTINYRLGALGFLAIERSDIQGNQGLKDQIMALRWVKENIAKFGGDPGRITISGLSAGGISVHAHVLSPMGKDEDLFQRAISISGNMLILPQAVYQKRTVIDSIKFFENLCGVNTTISGIPEHLDNTCLYTITAEDIINEMNKAFLVAIKPLEEQEEFEKSQDVPTYFMWPLIDDFSDNPFLPSNPITILHKGEQKMVPYMTGLTSDEGALVLGKLWKDMDPEDNKLQDHWGYVGAKTLFYEKVEEITFESKLKAKMVAHFYVGEDGITRDNKQGMIDMFTDAYFAHPNNEAVKLHAQYKPEVFNYLFTYKGNNSLAPFYSMGDPVASKEEFGVVHADDIFYMFKLTLNGKSVGMTPNDKKAVELYQKLLVNFARYGNPTPVASDDLPIWEPVQKSKDASVYYNINLTPKVEHRMFAERMKFWNLIEFQDLLEKYAMDEEEEELLDEIETTIIEVEEEEQDEKDDDQVDQHNGHHRKGRRHGKQLRKQRQGRWRKFKQKKLAKLKRLAEKLKHFQCSNE